MLSDLVAKASALGRSAPIVGIDLTGSERRASGWAVLDGTRATTALLKSDADIVARTLASKPELVSIDSPLSLPGGKASLEEWQRAGLPIYRGSELALKRMGIGVFWCLLPSMSAMTLRGIALARTFRASGIPVIESYPGGAQDLLGIPRKRANFEELKHGLQRAGIEGDFVDRKVSHDEIDAITAALVGLFYLADEVVALGNALEDYLIIPRSSRIDYPRLGAILERTGLDPLRAVS